MKERGCFVDENLIKREVGKNGIMLPPWKYYKGIHPSDIFYRMGCGQTYMIALLDWLSELSQIKRKEYIKSHFPIPEEWVLWALEVYVYHEDLDDDEVLESLDEDMKELLNE